MSGWKNGSGVDQRAAEAAARGATKAPEFATKIWQSMKGAFGSKASAEEKKAEDMKKPESERESTF
jgi:hypothetical protein